VIHQVTELKNSKTPHIDFLKFIRKHNLIGSSHNRALIVFDGHPVKEAQSNDNLTIIFSCAQSADDIIKNKLGAFKNNRQVIVVSDDNEIRQFAKICAITRMPVKEFLGKYIKAKQIKQVSDNENKKDISYSVQREITEEMTRIWLKDSYKL
jgi:hypothetical protein